jgi:hypothetical protein
MTRNAMTHGVSLSCVAVALLAVAPAHARTEIVPYLEVNQTVLAELKGGNDVLTYSTVAAGVDMSVQTQRTQAQINARYEHRFGWGKRLGDEDVISGLARARHEVIPGKLSIEAGALATRTRSDIRGDAPALLGIDDNNVTNLYSAYVGPTYKSDIGPVEVGAAYRLAYTAVDGNDFLPGPGQPRIDSYDDSIAHGATATVGMSPGQLPFGWTVTGAYTREDTGQLDQRFESMGVRGDVIVPVSPTVGLLAGVGYEDIEASERAPLFDVAGNPVVNSKGRFVTDPNSPRLLGYDFDGVYWDVGVAWRPSRRTAVEAHVGRRYGSWSYTGSLAWQADQSTSVAIGVYDNVQTFGQQLTNGLALIPTSFATVRSNLAPQFGNCVFGAEGQSAGSCLSPALGAVNSSVFRTRGVTGLVSRSRGRWNMGLGVGYSQRKYLTPEIPGAFTLDGVKDESWFAQANVGYKIDQQSAIDTAVFASLYNSGIVAAPNVLSTGATASYYRNIGRRLSAQATLGLYSFKPEDQEGTLNAAGQVGLRYSF